MNILDYSIIEGTKEINFWYNELDYEPFETWVEGKNLFYKEEDIPLPDEHTPKYIKLIESNESVSYFQKVLRLPKSTSTFKIMVTINGEKDRSDYLINYNLFDGLNISTNIDTITVNVKKNIKQTSFAFSIDIIDVFDKTNKVSLDVRQDPDIHSITISEVNINTCIKEETKQIDNSEFDYQLDTLIGKNDCDSETLNFRITIMGGSEKFRLKGIKKYDYVESVNGNKNYTYREGKWYYKTKKVVDGVYINYYENAFVKDGKSYRISTYDNAFKIETDFISFFNVKQYGRIFTSESSFYEIILCHRNDKTKLCTITLTYADIPTN